jgi:type VI protein secretion system component VasF
MPQTRASLLGDQFGGAPWADEDEIGWVEPQRRAPAAPAGSRRASARGQEPAGSRRTIQISGRGAERRLPPPPPHSASRSVSHRAHRAPDRIALWAVVLGIVLLLVAATSAHSQTLHVHRARLSGAALYR